eukprot:CAMPEP_0173295232 /NCGR_PEP_ID=MMETSP1143-20121109/14325_1 /TAXON_ID=483371 /ORGANISM="non described non described, Strain CCMP2298" /LENGTH=118 /DNA_ID=CAMNT_0014235019 /DNA_START=180 /DNA_END=536 /DNA_ORIENTATION=+
MTSNEPLVEIRSKDEEQQQNEGVEDVAGAGDGCLVVLLQLLGLGQFGFAPVGGGGSAPVGGGGSGRVSGSISTAPDLARHVRDRLNGLHFVLWDARRDVVGRRLAGGHGLCCGLSGHR